MTKQNVQSQMGQSNQRGFTLIEVVMAMAILATVVVAAVSPLLIYLKDMKAVQTAAARVGVVNELRLASRDVQSLDNSSAMSTDLGPCTDLLVSGTPCISKDGGGNYIRHPFSYVSSTDATRVLAGPDDPALSATDPLRTYYTADGAPCASTDPAGSCPLQAVASFIAYCVNGDTQCETAQSIEIIYAVKLRSELANDPAYAHLKSLTGNMVVNLQEQNYIKIGEASSPTGGSITETEVTQARVLIARPTENVRATVFVRETSQISTIEARVYRYANGCTFSNLGSTGCVRPTDPSAFTLIQTRNVTSGSTFGQYIFDLPIQHTSIAEVLFVSRNSGGTIVRRAQTFLKVKPYLDPILTITGPSQVFEHCTDPNFVFSFTFRAQDDSGFTSVRARVSPALPGGSTDFPGFASSFNIANPNPQTINVRYNQFAPGVTYTVTLDTTNTDGIQRSSTPYSFNVRGPNNRLVEISSPSANSFIRAFDSLTVNSVVKLRCGETPGNVRATVASGGATWMNDQNLTCSLAAGAQPFENNYNCNQTFACATWLGLGNCADFNQPNNTQVNLQITANPPGAVPSFGQSVDFRVGAKISVELDAISRRFITFPGYLSTSTMPLRLRFSASPPQNANLTLTYSSGTTFNFTCNSGQQNCNVNAPIVVGDYTATLSIAPSSQTFYQVGENGIVTVSQETSMQSCAAQVTAPICAPGQSLRSQVNALSTHDLSLSSSVSGTVSIMGGAGVDIRVLHRVTSINASQTVSLRTTVSHFAANGDLLAQTTTTPRSEPSANDYKAFTINTDYLAIHTSQAYFSSSNIDFVVQGSGIDFVLVRQCYCQ